MIVIVCVDDAKGMMFNGRRQSRDKMLIKKVIDITKDSRLWIEEYSKALFNSANVCVCENYLHEADKNEYCFVETKQLCPFEDKIEKLIVFKWNRLYPSDVKLDISPDDWKLVDTEDFPGNSHEKITMEVYEK